MKNPSTSPPHVRHLPRAFSSRAVRIVRDEKAPPDRAVPRVAPAFVYSFETGDAEAVPAIVGTQAYLVRDGAVVAFDGRSHRSVRVRTGVPGGRVFATAGVLVLSLGNYDRGYSMVAIDRESGARRWSRPGRLLGAGAGTVVAMVDRVKRTAYVPNDEDADHDSFVGLDAATGNRRWLVAGLTCEPRSPVTFFRSWAVLPWAYACAASANEPYINFIHLRNDAEHLADGSTGFLARRGNDVYLTGDDQHYGSYGPGNLTVYRIGPDVRRERYLPIAPDDPRNDPWALERDASAYALADALWVEIDTSERRDPFFPGHVYQYDLSKAKPAPVRFDRRFGAWLGAAAGAEGYFARNDRLIAVAMNHRGAGTIVEFAGHVRGAANAIVDGTTIYVGSASGDIAVYDRPSRRESRTIVAHCVKLASIVSFGGNRYAVCGPDVSRAQLVEL